LYKETQNFLYHDILIAQKGKHV